MIIGIHGQKSSGKSTASIYFTGHGFTLVSFAEPLKSMLVELMRSAGMSNPIISEYMNERKESIIPEFGCSFRHLAQTLGTEWGRNLIREDLWVQVAGRKIDQIERREQLNGDDLRVVIDDVRFESEATFIRERGGIVIHITRPMRRATDNHASERPLVVQHGDICVTNDGSVADLHRRIDEALLDAGVLSGGTA